MLVNAEAIVRLIALGRYDRDDADEAARGVQSMLQAHYDDVQTDVLLGSDIIEAMIDGVAVCVRHAFRSRSEAGPNAGRVARCEGVRAVVMVMSSPVPLAPHIAGRPVYVVGV